MYAIRSYYGKMSYLIAATNNDAVNMMASIIGDRFGIKRKIARIRSRQFGNDDSILTAHDLKLDLLINPEELAAQEIVRLIKLNAGNEIVDIADGQIQLLSTEITDQSPRITSYNVCYTKLLRALSVFCFLFY